MSRPATSVLLPPYACSDAVGAGVYNLPAVSETAWEAEGVAMWEDSFPSRSGTRREPPHAWRHPVWEDPFPSRSSSCPRVVRGGHASVKEGLLRVRRVPAHPYLQWGTLQVRGLRSHAPGVQLGAGALMARGSIIIDTPCCRAHSVALSASGHTAEIQLVLKNA